MSDEKFLLDTNVVSELMRPAPSPPVLDWIDTVGVARLALSSISRCEIRYGLASLSTGKRRDGLTRRFDGLVRDLFGAGVFDFTASAAEQCASIMARKRELGESLDDHLPDAMIAATAADAGLTVATRNFTEFRNCGVALVDLWAPLDQT